MQKYIDKVEVLVEALPYIKEFNGKTVVIKYGGSAMTNENIKKTIIQDITLMKLVGMKPVIVHGGGPEINNIIRQLGKVPEFIDGLRVTDKETIEIVEMVLTGKVNKSIVSELQKQGINSVGISGKDGMLIEAEKKLTNGVDLGFVGEITKINIGILDTLINNDFVPVISPVGSDREGNGYNINADYAAIAIAGALKAQKLVFLTDVEGVLRDFEDKSSVISVLTPQEIVDLIEQKIISGGMIPKVECCVKAIEEGVEAVHIIDGRHEHSLLLEIFTKKGIGTIVKECV
jgi:acetylglutamate kinase